MTTTTASRTARVWDLPTRVFHGLMIASFAGAWLTADSERWRLVHVTLGLTMAGLVLWRLFWGFAGTRHARFADFVRGPAAVGRYLKSLTGGRPEHHSGHNPAGGWAILGLLGLTAVTTALGWAAYSEWGGDWLGEGHELAANLMIGLVGMHVAGVLVSSWLHRENLVRAMVTGRKAVDEPDVKPWRVVGMTLLAAVLGFWALQWQQAPLAAPQAAASQHRHQDHDED